LSWGNSIIPVITIASQAPLASGLFELSRFVSSSTILPITNSSGAWFPAAT